VDHFRHRGARADQFRDLSRLLVLRRRELVQRPVKLPNPFGKLLGANNSRLLKWQINLRPQACQAYRFLKVRSACEDERTDPRRPAQDLLDQRFGLKRRRADLDDNAVEVLLVEQPQRFAWVVDLKQRIGRSLECLLKGSRDRFIAAEIENP